MDNEYFITKLNNLSTKYRLIFTKDDLEKSEFITNEELNVCLKVIKNNIKVLRIQIIVIRKMYYNLIILWSIDDEINGRTIKLPITVCSIGQIIDTINLKV